MLEITIWHWLALAAIFVVIEIVLPGAMMLWVGVAAALTGLVLLAFPALGWEMQIALFSVLAVLAVVLSRSLLRGSKVTSSDPQLNQRLARLQGKTGVLLEAISHGRGRAQIGDSSWPVCGPDLPSGTAVRVVGEIEDVLQVEKAGN